MLDMAQTRDDWFSEVLPVNVTNAMSEAAVEQQRLEYTGIFGKEAADALIDQEYYCSFEAAILGAYWGKEMLLAAQHRTKLHSTNPLERLNKEVKRRADVVGIFPNEESIVRLVGAVLMEHNDDWQAQNRYMQIEGFAEPADKPADLKPLQITPRAA
jgi:hypothetical protein